MNNPRSLVKQHSLWCVAYINVGTTWVELIQSHPTLQLLPTTLLWCIALLTASLLSGVKKECPAGTHKLNQTPHSFQTKPPPHNPLIRPACPPTSLPASERARTHTSTCQDHISMSPALQCPRGFWWDLRSSTGASSHQTRVWSACRAGQTWLNAFKESLMLKPVQFCPYISLY